MTNLAALMLSNKSTLPSGVDRYLLTWVNSKVEKTKEGSLVRQVSLKAMHSY